MKKYAFLLLSIVSLQAVYSQSQRLLGTWEGTDKENASGKVVFEEDKSALLYIEGQEIRIVEYTIDNTSSPIVIELRTVVDGQEKVLYSLAEFIDANTIKWELFTPDTKNRPEQFSESSTDNQIILRRAR